MVIQYTILLHHEIGIQTICTSSVSDIILLQMRLHYVLQNAFDYEIILSKETLQYNPSRVALNSSKLQTISFKVNPIRY